MDKGHMPTAMSADEAAFRNPPPSYEQVMGAYQGSINIANNMPGSDLPPLAYIDIMPRCLNTGNWATNRAPEFENYSTTLEAANRFLVENPGLAVWKCESVTRRLNMSKDGALSYELNTMIRHESTFGLVVYLKGLRLWLTKDPAPESSLQQVGLISVVPKKMTVAMPARGYYRPGAVIVDGMEHSTTHIHTLNQFDTFEGLEDTIKHLQARLEQDSIPGTILTLETDKVKAYEQFKDDLDPEATCWAENKDVSRRFTQVIRIFFLKGPSVEEQIGYQEFIPEVIDAPDAVKPGRFEPFEDLMHKLAIWISANQGLRIVNIQQYDAVVDRCFDKLKVSSDSTDDYASAFQDQRYVRILRVFYTKSSAVKRLPANYVTSRLFIPMRTGPKTFECMTETMARIEAWLRVTGLPIYSVETVELLFNENHQLGTECIKSDYTVYKLSGKHWVTAIRVYFSTPYSEPDPSQLPALPTYMCNSQASSSCRIL